MVSDVGADRGIIIAESGFQSGAIEAAHLTNIQVTSLKDLQSQVSQDVFELRLRILNERISKLNCLYYDMPKAKRIEVGLRQDTGAPSYSGGVIILFCQDLFSAAFLNKFPIYPLNFGHSLGVPIPDLIQNKEELQTFVTPIIDDLEKRLESLRSTIS
jgi:hypothetical protein